MHDHIKKLLDRHYVVKDQSMRFQPTSLVSLGFRVASYMLYNREKH